MDEERRKENKTKTRFDADKRAAPSYVARDSRPPKKKVKGENKVTLASNSKSGIVEINLGSDSESEDDAVQIQTVDTVCSSSSTTDDEGEWMECPRGSESAGVGIKMKPLQFHKLMDEVVPSKKIVLKIPNKRWSKKHPYVEHQMEFSLSKKMCDLISDNNSKAQVFLRFCLLNDSFARGEEEFYQDQCPPELDMIVNGVPWYDPKWADAQTEEDQLSLERRPVNVTVDVHWVPGKKNEMTLAWYEPDLSNSPKKYALGVSVWKPLNVEDIFEELPTASTKLTLEKIKSIIGSTTGSSNSKKDATVVDKVEPEDKGGVCAPTSLSISLKCPVTMKLIENPCRGANCKHVQCFDAKTFLEMIYSSYKANARIPNVSCPVCKEKMNLAELTIDQYFLEVLREMKRRNCNKTEIKISSDGKWAPK